MWRRYGDCASTAVHHACCTTADARRALSSCSRRTPACVTGVTTGRGRWRRARGDKPADRTPTSAADLGGGPCRERARKCSKDVGNAERSRARGAQQPLPARAAALSLLQLIPTPSVLHAGSGTTPVRLLPDTLGPTRLRAALAVPLAVRSLSLARALCRMSRLSLTTD